MKFNAKKLLSLMLALTTLLTAVSLLACADNNSGEKPKPNNNKNKQKLTRTVVTRVSTHICLVANH